MGIRAWGTIMKMAGWRMRAGVILLALGVTFGLAGAQPETPARAALLEIDGAIGPATSDYFGRTLKRAVDNGARLIILRIDTPGGLDTAMREIIKTILASPVPVVAYVDPAGSRAASAGTYILYAAHLSAMAPATSLGAATPVRIGGGAPFSPGGDKPEAGGSANKGSKDKKGTPAPTGGSAMENKVLNDAVAFIRGLAERRGRNAEWAERAVREGVSLPSHEAVKQKVVDYTANNLDELLAKIDGRTVETTAGKITLNTKDMAVERMPPDWRSQFLSVITSPTIAVILMMIGIYGLIFEGYSPGAIVPGVVGVICLLLGLFALQALPLNYVGFALIIFGVALMVAESMVPSFGALGFGGITAFVFGAIMLVDTDVPGFGVNRGVIGGIAAAAALVMMFTLYQVRRTRHMPVPVSDGVAPGTLAEVLTFEGGIGWAMLHGEHWRISSRAALQPGQRVAVARTEGLTLFVEPVETDSLSVPGPGQST